MKDEILKELILSVITESQKKLTPLMLEKELIKRKPCLNKKKIKIAMSGLIVDEILHYTYMYGNSFVEMSFNKPVQVSKHVVLVPERLKIEEENRIIIYLIHGASFGTGAHPTTRLAIRGVEYVWENLEENRDVKKQRALDIGTGSGVLAILAAKLGYEHVDAVDIDACSRVEAKNNIKLNEMENNISVSDKDLLELKSTYGLIMANLRFPTIMDICALMKKMIKHRGWFVISGIKQNEKNKVIQEYENHGFLCKHQEVEMGWAGLGLFKIE